MNAPVDLSEAVVLFLKRYPSSNSAEFEATVSSEATRSEVQSLLDETMAVPIEWDEKSLVEIGDEVVTVMRERHPDLSEAALRKLGSYFTYLVK
ncbi:hypothetical protein [Aeromicrobium alkaliterrae]|uniref:DUF3349 domain-containing protein n=1 Tax=Aeromicrobium alkaliterrae TaxID=302168 RepID=A0ABN2JHC2_9ACTN